MRETKKFTAKIKSKIKDEIADAIKEMNAAQTSEIEKGITKYIASVFDEHQDYLDGRLKEIYADIKQTDDIQMKLKLSVPLLNLIGINLETEFDIKSWVSKMYEKHELKLFKLMGYL
ncbi:MAG: hypothetical protein HN704_15920 [Bacteroidetes bacterium]|jgi:hypothetical protein|nr:hypothetical protein [Bacteroidota bacterium]MBT6688143.1 hypothetical protein [Bacteroidota bacterium]MBT7142960.1 hypothetical protein [Bacteroidota bacterium]MBT7493085.1 hypothetical protein [Bacteroidota bacterium]